MTCAPRSGWHATEIIILYCITVCKHRTYLFKTDRTIVYCRQCRSPRASQKDSSGDQSCRSHSVGTKRPTQQPAVGTSKTKHIKRLNGIIIDRIFGFRSCRFDSKIVYYVHCGVATVRTKTIKIITNNRQYEYYEHVVVYCRSRTIASVTRYTMGKVVLSFVFCHPDVITVRRRENCTQNTTGLTL